MELTNIQYAGIWFYFGWTAANMMVADNKNIKGWTHVVLSLLFTPVVGSIYVIGTPKNSD